MTTHKKSLVVLCPLVYYKEIKNFMKESKKSITHSDQIRRSKEFHDALGIPFRLPKYRRVVPRFDGKHACTFDVIMSDTPPSKSDVGIVRATNSKCYPTG
jgi:hypothetical protein